MSLYVRMKNTPNHSTRLMSIIGKVKAEVTHELREFAMDKADANG